MCVYLFCVWQEERKKTRYKITKELCGRIVKKPNVVVQVSCLFFDIYVTGNPNYPIQIVFTDWHLHHLWQPVQGGGGSLFLIILSFEGWGKGNYFPTECPVRQTALHSSQSGDQQKDFQSLLGLAALWIWLWLWLWLLKEIVTKAMGNPNGLLKAWLL